MPLSTIFQSYRGSSVRVPLLTKQKYVSKSALILNTVKSVLRGHFGSKKKWSFNTGDCLIEVATWAGLTLTVHT